MATESFIVTALPHSVAEDADVHVAVFVAPEDRSGRTGPGSSASSTLFVDWAATVVGDTRFELRDQAGRSSARPLLDRIHPDGVAAAVPADTPVLNRAEPDPRRAALAHVPPRLPARRGQAPARHGDVLRPHIASAVRRHPLTEPLRRLPPCSPTRYCASATTSPHVTRAAATAAIGEFRGSDLTLLGLEHQLDGMAGLDRFALELHRARRFYERPESAVPYQAAGATDKARRCRSWPPPTPDFHERVTSVGDHPALLRRLGLVDRPPGRRRGPAAHERLAVGSGSSTGDTKAGRLTAGSAVQRLATPTSPCPETSDWHHGRLRLGDTERFEVLDIDPDGSALKLDRFVWTLPRLVTVEKNGDPIHAAPPALRSSGLHGRAHRKAQELRPRIAGASCRRSYGPACLPSARPRTSPAACASRSGTTTTKRGRRCTRGSSTSSRRRFRHWCSTTSRTSRLHPGDRRLDQTVGADGSARCTSTRRLFGWDGWSLAAPQARPQRVRMETPDRASGRRRAGHDRDRRAGDGDALPERPHRSVHQPGREPGHLPRLRYGRSYAFRAWAVDLAGNSRPHALGPAAVAAPFTSAVASLLVLVGVPTLGTLSRTRCGLCCSPAS